MTKSDSELVLVCSHFTKPQDRTADVGAAYETEFPDIHASYAQLHGSDGSSNTTDRRSGNAPPDAGQLSASSNAMTAASLQSHEKSSCEISTMDDNNHDHYAVPPKNFQWWWSNFEGPSGSCRMFMDTPGNVTHTR